MADTINVQVPINTDGIDSAFAKVMLESAIGKEISKAVEGTLKGSGYGRSVLEQAVSACINSEIQRLVRLELMKPEINETIRARISEKLTDDLVLRFIDKSMERMRFGEY